MNRKLELEKDIELERRIAVQEVIDRILKYGEAYLNKLNSLNNRFYSPHEYNQNQIKQHTNEQIERPRGNA